MTAQNSDNSVHQLPGLHAKLFDKRKSSLQKYREMTIGSGGILALLQYELIIMFAGPMPGALGYLLRKVLYKRILKQVGRNVVFGRSITLRHPHKVSIGDDVIIDEGCLIDAKGDDNEGIKFGDSVTIGRFSSIVCKNGNIIIGDGVNIGSAVKIIVGERGRIRIGNSIDIGSSCHFSAGSYDYTQIAVLPSSRRQATKGIVVEDMAWIGAGSILLDGVTIGSHSIVGAGSVVNRDADPKTVVAGVPAKFIKQRTEIKQHVTPLQKGYQS